MEQAKNRKALRTQFLKDHPFCCFCGGIHKSETEDHVPPRCLFRNKHWPEGYAFPACEPCNQATSKDELLLAWLARFSLPNPTPTDTAEFTYYMKAIHNNFVGEPQAMYLRAAEKRHAAARVGIKPPQGSTMPSCRYPPSMKRAIERVAFKLGCALYYKHGGTPLSVEGQIDFVWKNNVEILGTDLTEDLLRAVPGHAILNRCNTSLSDQFFYRFGLVPELRSGVFLCMIRETILLNIVAVADLTLLPQLPDTFRLKVGGYLR